MFFPLNTGNVQFLFTLHSCPKNNKEKPNQPSKSKSFLNQESVHLKLFFHETHPKHIICRFFLARIQCPHLPLPKNPRYQQHQEPFLAVVVDPVRTCASGKVDIGAFRTYPAGHTPAVSWCFFVVGFLYKWKYFTPKN